MTSNNGKTNCKVPIQGEGGADGIFLPVSACNSGKANSGKGQDSKKMHSTNGAEITPQALLLQKHDSSSWSKLGKELGVNKGLLNAVANGKRRAPNSLIAKMNKIYRLHLKFNMVPVPPCRKCGEGHPARRCTRRPTFEDRCEDYKRWLSQQRANFESLLVWADQVAR